MGKVWSYVVMSLGLLMLLQFAGLPNGATGAIFTTVGLTFNEDESVGNVTTSASNFFDVLFQDEVVGGITFKGILAAIGVALGTVVVGFFARAKIENLILLPFITGTLVLFLSAFKAIVTQAVDLGVPWVGAVVAIFFVPFIVGFIIALAEFFRGTD